MPEFVPIPPLADQLVANAHHPALAHFEGIGGSVWPDDHPIHPQLLFNCVCRFRRNGEVAYIWFNGEHWWVRPWRPLRRLSLQLERVGSLEAALDVLVPRPAATRVRRSWWKWGSRA